MKKIFVFPGLCIFLIFGSIFHSLTLEVARAAPARGEKTLVLYDAATGTVPGAPLMNFTDFPPGVASPSYSNIATVLDTTASGRDTYAGWISNGTNTPGFPILDRAASFQVDFTLRIENESHRNNDRSGFSLIILSEDAKGIELAFWENEIWVQNDSSTGGLFKHGEGAIFPTTTGLINYQLVVTGDTYTLAADTQPILNGPVRDYSDFEDFPDPYQTPNFLFLGDDTTSAQARVQLEFVAITGAEPLMPTSTNTSTNTKSPSPTASLTPAPRVTPIPSPTPTGKAPNVCLSNGLFLTVMFTSIVMLKYIRKKQS
ncbi:MAG: hypothetical protein WBL25_03270 [Anaerolineales bacterium]